MNSECIEHQQLLPDLVDGQLNTLQQQRLDQHLNQCEACSAHLADLWQLEAVASQWHEQEVPTWQRRKLFFEESSWLPNLQWVSSFASVLVLVLVLTNANVSTTDGFTIQFGQPNDLNQEKVAELLAALETKQDQRLDDTVATLAAQQVATNQLMLRTVMEMSREERKDELSTLLTVWDRAQDQRSQQTKESISVLFASQLEDKRDIDQM